VFILFRVQIELNKIEFNILNPYLIVPVGHRLIFDGDGKRIPKARDKVTTSHS